MFMSQLCFLCLVLLQGQASLLTADFTSPEQLGTSPSTMLWLMPLAAAIAVVYKATKLSAIKPGHFVKEVVVLFGSIVVFIIISAIVLLGFAWLIS